MSDDRLSALLHEAAPPSESRLDPDDLVRLARHRRTGKRSTVGAALALLAVGGLFVAANRTSERPPQLASGGRTGSPASPAPAAGGTYTLVDQRTLRVEVQVGGGCEPAGTATAAVAETSVEVRLSIAVTHASAPPLPADGTCTAMALEQFVYMALAAPLDNRVVVDVLTGQTLHLAP